MSKIAFDGSSSANSSAPCSLGTSRQPLRNIPVTPREDIYLTPLGSPMPQAKPAPVDLSAATLTVSPLAPHLGYGAQAINNASSSQQGGRLTFAAHRDARFQDVPRLSGAVAAHLKDTMKWQIDAETLECSVNYKLLSRRDYRTQLLERDQKLGIIKSFFLSRVQGVSYSSTLKKVVVIDEVTRTWHPDYLKHQVAKAMTQRALELHLSRKATKDNLDPTVFLQKLNDLHTPRKRYRPKMVVWSTYHALHAESVAKAVAPTHRGAPWRQQLWKSFFWLFVPQYAYVQRSVAAHRKTFAELQRRAPDLCNTIYRYGGLAEALLSKDVACVHLVPRARQKAVHAAAVTLVDINPSGVGRSLIYGPGGDMFVP